MLLHAPLPPGAATGWSSSLLAALPYARRLVLEGRPEPRRNHSLAGLALALSTCARLRAGTPPPVSMLAWDAAGKPRFVAGPCFSLSHCDGYVACVAVESVAVGLDIEAVSVADRRDEISRWTAIEAVLKAAGSSVRAAAEVEIAPNGLTARLAGDDYRLQEVSGLPSHLLAHVASRSPVAFDVEAVMLDGSDVASAIERSLRHAT